MKTRKKKKDLIFHFFSEFSRVPFCPKNFFSVFNSYSDLFSSYESRRCKEMIWSWWKPDYFLKCLVSPRSPLYLVGFMSIFSLFKIKCTDQMARKAVFTLLSDSWIDGDSNCLFIYLSIHRVVFFFFLLLLGKPGAKPTVVFRVENRQRS